MRSLITGVGGFVGQHLVAGLLAESSGEVFGIARGPVKWHGPDYCEAPAFHLLMADLARPAEVRRAVETARPDHIYLLAAMASPAASFSDPLGTINNNAACVVNPLEAVREVVPHARVVLVSSAEVYGSSPAGGAVVNEDVAFAPENPYALSKATQDLLGRQYYVAYQLDIVRMRPFNHTGPGQSDRFVTSSLARQIAEVEAGFREPVIEVGNMNTIRDFTDVRDVVRAYQLAAALGVGGEAYNLATGRGTSIQNLLDGLASLSRIPVSVHHDPTRERPADASALVGDASRFCRQTGWQPVIPLAQTLSDILDDWRRRIR